MGLLQSRPPAPKFVEIGTRHGGELLADSVEEQQRNFDTGDPMFWDDGNPRLQVVVEYAGPVDPTIPDDDGVRTFYLKGDMLRAVKEAKRKAGLGRTPVLPKGAVLFVEFVDEEPLPRGKKGKPKKIYDAEMYAPPAREGEEKPLDRLAGHHERNEKARQAAGSKRTADEEPPF